MNNPTNKESKFFDFLEKKIVFQISRTFFWILCTIAGLALIVSLVLFLYNVIPPIKETVAKPETPPEVSVSLSEIQRAIIPPPKPRAETPVERTRTTTEQESKRVTETPPPPLDPLQVKLNAVIDTLKSYFPANKYTWTTLYEKVPAWVDYWGVVREYKTVVKVYGLDRYLNRILDFYPDKIKKIEIVRDITGIISKIADDPENKEEKNREKALSAYVDIRLRKERDRERTIEELNNEYEYKLRNAELKYAAEKVKKTRGLMDSLKYIAGAFISIAIIGLFLCFLAVERNTRTLQALLEKEKTI